MRIAVFALALPFAASAQVPTITGVFHPLAGYGATGLAPGLVVGIAGSNFGLPVTVEVGGKAAAVLGTYKDDDGESIGIQLPWELALGASTLEVIAAGSRRRRSQ
jgi:hypothetical protein